MDPATALDEKLTSLKSEIDKYKIEICDHITFLYSPNSFSSIQGKQGQLIDLKNDPRFAIQVTKIRIFFLIKEGFIVYEINR